MKPDRAKIVGVILGLLLNLGTVTLAAPAETGPYETLSNYFQNSPSAATFEDLSIEKTCIFAEKGDLLTRQMKFLRLQNTGRPECVLWYFGKYFPNPREEVCAVEEIDLSSSRELVVTHGDQGNSYTRIHFRKNEQFVLFAIDAYGTDSEESPTWVANDAFGYCY